LYDGGFLRVSVSADEFEGDDAILVYTLQEGKGREEQVLTIGGPRTVPFQMDMVRSSGSARPYEMDPSPVLSFSPRSSSSRSRKLLGTLIGIDGDGGEGTN
jgi:hypothetical protein